MTAKELGDLRLLEMVERGEAIGPVLLDGWVISINKKFRSKTSGRVYRTDEYDHRLSNGGRAELERLRALEHEGAS